MLTGFIGTGSMGSILIEAFIRSGALRPEEIVAANRTPAKAEQLALRFPGLRSASSAVEVAADSDILFLCVKPGDFPALLKVIAPLCREDQLIVSITSPVMLSQLEERLPGKIIKVIPSVTNYVLSGAALCIYGSRVRPEDKARLEQLLAPISRPLEVSEEHTRISSDLSSCGPAFLSFLLAKLVDAAVEIAAINRSEAERMASEMLLGTGMLLTAGGMSPEDVIKRVAVPGGITEEALRLLEKELGSTFTRLIGSTHAKFREDAEKVAELFERG
ncbi:late competence protein ComER [Gorillibacterium timonense]|uniref:late competence protein ComER n=1 Tax=Gorillibacterium timonense TaxID=1689269 RepID=UPI000A6EA9B8|nr:late competence protein ComER [Gorillibacterium timonense]